MRSRWLDIDTGRNLLSTALERNGKGSFCLEIFGEFREERKYAVRYRCSRCCLISYIQAEGNSLFFSSISIFSKGF